MATPPPPVRTERPVPAGGSRSGDAELGGVGRLLLLPFLLLALSCVDGNEVTRPEGPNPDASLALQPARTAALTGSSKPVNVLRASATWVQQDSVLARTEEEVDPDAAPWTLEISVPVLGGDSVQVMVAVELIHEADDGTRSAEWSGRAGPLTVTPGDLPTEVRQVELGRGPLRNLLVTGVDVTPNSVRIPIGGSADLSAELSTSEEPDSALQIFWTSLNDEVASVDGQGRVSGLAAGTAGVVASSGTHADTTSVEVVGVPEEVEVTPDFAELDQNGTAGFSATAFAVDGSELQEFSFTWSTADSSVATVDDTGTVTGVGTDTTSVTAETSGVADTSKVVVAGPSDIVSTAFAGSAYESTGQAGDTVTVPVIFDMSRVSSTGDLGSAELELTYDPTVLAFETATVEASGSGDYNVPSAGTFKFAFVSTSPQDPNDEDTDDTFTLVTVTFVVRTEAPADTDGLLRLHYTANPTDTAFNAYSLPLSVDGRLLVP